MAFSSENREQVEDKRALSTREIYFWRNLPLLFERPNEYVPFFKLPKTTEHSRDSHEITISPHQWQWPRYINSMTSAVIQTTIQYNQYRLNSLHKQLKKCSTHLTIARRSDLLESSSTSGKPENPVRIISATRAAGTVARDIMCVERGPDPLQRRRRRRAYSPDAEQLRRSETLLRCLCSSARPRLCAIVAVCATHNPLATTPNPRI